MKGTFFSGDFIKDELGNLRLLELNTDTAAGQSSSALLDFTPLYQTMVDNNLNTLDIIYKSIHQHIVERIESTYSTTIPSLTINLHLENPNSVYPTTITETGSNFILRLVYDENAIFDSTYIKDRFNTFNLFTSNNDSADVVDYAYTDSDGNLHKKIDDSLLDLNGDSVPDFVIKQNTKGSGQSHKFVKVGVRSESKTNRVDGLINSIDQNQQILERYHFGGSSLDSNNKIISIRSYNIVYGSNLDVMSIGCTESPSYFEKPSFIDYSVNEELLQNGDFSSGSNSWIVGVDDNSPAPTIEDSGNTHYSVNVDTVGERYSVNLTQKVTISIGGDYVIEFDAWSDRNRDIIVGIGLSQDPWYNTTETVSITTERKTYRVFLNASNFGVGESTRLLFDLGEQVGLVNIDDVSLKHDNQYLNEVDKKHYYEFATNAIVSGDVPGLLEDHTIVLSDGTDKLLSEIEVNDVVKSVNIEGLDLDEANSSEWQMTGSTFPAGSTETTATVVGIVGGTTKNNVFASLKTTNSGEIYCGINKKFLVYNTITNISKFELVTNLDPSVNKLVNLDNSLVDILSIDYVITEEEKQFITIDTEPADNFIIGDSGIMSSPVITHNKFLIPQDCFIGGTRVTLSNNEYKNIEDIVVGDEVLSFNEESGEVEPKKVLSLNNPIHDDLVKYTLSNGTTLTSTYDHPYYVKGKGLASYDSYKTNLLYDLGEREVVKIEVGDILSDIQLNDVTIESIEELERVDTQTFIIHVEDNNNFFAEDILVHNKQE